ncbi:unnamed protein product, partial [Iphiclides podalirius]
MPPFKTGLLKRKINDESKDTERKNSSHSIDENVDLIRGDLDDEQDSADSENMMIMSLLILSEMKFYSMTVITHIQSMMGMNLLKNHLSFLILRLSRMLSVVQVKKKVKMIN